MFDGFMSRLCCSLGTCCFSWIGLWSLILLLELLVRFVLGNSRFSSPVHVSDCWDPECLGGLLLL